MKMTRRIIFAVTAMLLAIVVHGEIVGTNVPNHFSLAGNGFPSTNALEILPSIQFRDVPITMGISRLANLSHINYIIDPNACPKLTIFYFLTSPEPMVTFTLTNISPKEALTRMLNLRGYELVEIPYTSVSRIFPTGEKHGFLDASVIGLETNAPSTNASEVVPHVRFVDVPLATGLEHLFRMSGIRAEIDPSLSDPDDPSNRQLIVTVDWENISPRQAIVALCESYNLALTRDDETGVILVKPKEIKRRHHLQIR